MRFKKAAGKTRLLTASGMLLLGFAATAGTASAGVAPTPSAAPSPSGAAAAAHPSNETCVYNGDSGTPCMNEWNGSGANGNPVKVWQSGASHETWNLNFLGGMCGGGQVTSTCPFNVGSGLNTTFLGGTIVQYVGPHGECMATNTGNAQAVNGACNDYYGNGGATGSIQILWTSGGGNCAYNQWCIMVNRYWSNVHNAEEHVCPNGLSNGAPIIMSYAHSQCSLANKYWYSF